ncbi:hypothetical protein KKA69_05540 [Patescibacteria group bacterium]|nr:hypothetical protein [Patescibacteria group bacterium]
MKRPPNGAKFVFKKTLKNRFLAVIKQRLQDDVGTILNLVNQHNEKSERGIGYWALLRTLLPIIEAISHIENTTPQSILKKISIPTPYLMWDLFRNSLMHGDLIHYGEYKGKRIKWGVSISKDLTIHIIRDKKIHISVSKLYEDLNEYLDKSIASTNQIMIDVEVGVLYDDSNMNARKHIEREIVDEFSKL